MAHAHHGAEDTSGVADAPSSVAGGSTSGPGMQMAFYWGPQATFLSSSLTTSSWGMYILALLLCMLATVGFEGLFALRSSYSARMRLRYTKQKILGSVGRDNTAPGSSDQNKGSDPGGSALVSMEAASGNSPRLSGAQMSVLDRLVFSFLLATTAAYSYLLMFVVMTFNVGVFLAVIMGHFLGVFAFGSSRALHSEEGDEVAIGCHAY